MMCLFYPFMGLKEMRVRLWENIRVGHNSMLWPFCWCKLAIVVNEGGPKHCNIDCSIVFHNFGICSLIEEKIGKFIDVGLWAWIVKWV